MQPQIELTAAEIAAFVGGTVEGNPAAVVSRLASIEDAPAGSLTFLVDSKYTPLVAQLACAALMVDGRFQAPEGVQFSLIRVDHPQLAFAQVMARWFGAKLDFPAGIHPQAAVSPQAEVSPEAIIGPFCTVEPGARIEAGAHLYPGVYVGHDAVIGAGTVLHANVVVGYHCQIGRNCILHSGVVIGADGFGFARVKDQNHKVPQIGNVVIEDEVEIGANSTIDRATLGSTIIRARVKMDNLVHIAHNVEIGAFSLIAAQVGVAGSSKLGKGCLLGGQAAVSPHIVLPDFTQVSGQAGMSKTIKKAGRAFRGSPAREMAVQLKIEAHQGRLPELLKRLEELEAYVRSLHANGTSEAGAASTAPGASGS